MNRLQAYMEYFNSQSTQINILYFIFNLIAAAILSNLIAIVYCRYGNSLSNRKQFSGNFMLITLTTMLIITVVKSSLALSLGLVGALSIVRFRSAIKEPEELTYLFLSIAVGVGLGANRIVITTVALLLIIIAVVLKSRFSSEKISEDMTLLVSNDQNVIISIDQILAILNPISKQIKLKRIDESASNFEAAFSVSFDGIDSLNKAKDQLMKLSKNINVTFFDASNIL